MQVYKAIDKRDGRVVAVKEIPLEGMDESNTNAIKLEIELLSSLRHANIVSYLGSVKSNGYLYILLEYAENGSLAGVIKSNRFGPIPETLAAVYVAQVLDGLAYLHANGVVHRDIKGANILTTKDGTVKLADFGVATRNAGENGGDASVARYDASRRMSMLEDQDAVRDQVAGTPYWMAPEVIEMLGASPPSDVWSVACTVVELLTGSPPYFDLQPMPALFAIVRDTRPPIPAGVSPELKNFLTRCFHKDPEARPSAVELRSHDWLRDVKVPVRAPADRATTTTAPTPEVPRTSLPPSQTSNLSPRRKESAGAESAPPASASPSRRAPPHRSVSGPVVMKSLDAVSPSDAATSNANATATIEDVVLEGGWGGEGSDGVSSYDALADEVARLTLQLRVGKHLAVIVGAAERITAALRPSRCTPTASDAALAAAGTVPAVVSILEWAADSGGGEKGGEDDAAAAAADLMEVAIAKTSRNKKTEDRSGPVGVESAPGEALATFCLLGGLPAALSLLHPPHAPHCRLAVARLIRRVARSGGVALRCLIACNGLDALAAALGSGYTGYGRELTRVALDAVEATMALHRDDGSPSPGLSFGSASHRVINEHQNPQNRGFSARDGDEDESKDDAMGFGAVAGAAASRSDRSGRGGAMCRALARAGIIPRLVNTLAALNTAANEESGVGPAGLAMEPRPSDGGPDESGSSADQMEPGPGSVSARYRESVADLLLTVTRAGHDGGAEARVALCDIPVLHRLLALVGSPLPCAASGKLLALIRHLSRDPDALEPMQRAGAIPKLVRFLQWEDDATRECAMRALYNLCKGSKVRQEQAAVAGAVPHLIAIIAAGPDRDRAGAGIGGDGAGLGSKFGGGGGLGRNVPNGANGDGAHWHRNHASASMLAPLAAPLLCDMAASSRRTRAELAKHDAMDAYLVMARGRGRGEPSRGDGYALIAVDAVASWLAEEPWTVEARLMEPDAVAAVAAIMDPNKDPPPSVALLEALLRLLSKSNRVCAGLANGGAIAPLVEALGPPSSSISKSALATAPIRSTGGVSTALTLRRDAGSATQSLAVVKLLGALYEHHSRPKELVIGYDLPGRLRSLIARGGSSDKVGTRRDGLGYGVEGEEADVEEAAAASVVAIAEKLLSGMRLNK